MFNMILRPLSLRYSYSQKQITAGNVALEPKKTKRTQRTRKKFTHVIQKSYFLGRFSRIGSVILLLRKQAQNILDLATTNRTHALSLPSRPTAFVAHANVAARIDGAVDRFVHAHATFASTSGGASTTATSSRRRRWATILELHRAGRRRTRHRSGLRS